MAKKLTSTKAKKILHDKTVHGKPLTDKQRKFFGAVASGAIPQAQNGIEGTMGGLTDIGFNYNGAWGGTMQMGGAMPGAVGFTYARTAGAAPANGPYAKKTKASAQDGKNIEYKELPEIVVVGGKDKPTVDLYRKELDKLKSSENNPYYGIDEYAKYYAKMQIAKKYGVPKVRPTKPVNEISNYIRNRAGIKSNVNDPWPQYFPYEKTAYADFSNKYTKEYLPELAHYVSQNRKGYIKRDLLNAWEYAKGNNPYKVEGTEENYAHSIVEPELINFLIDKHIEGRAIASKDADNAMKRKLYEKSKKLQNGGEMKYYQEGLDFKPKTISQDGSKTPKKKKTLILAEHDPEYWNNPDGSFSDRHINPFMTEAAGIKKYVNKYFPNEDVEIIPTYKQNIKEVLTKSDPNTRLVVMGHHGDKMFGIPSSEFVESIGNTKYENCYAGICYGDDLPGIGRPSSESILTYLSRKEDDQNKKITTRYPESYNLNNFNVRTDNLGWLGFAPVDRGGEEGFKDSFFRRTKNPEIIKLQNQIRNIWDDSKEDYNVKSRKAAPIEAQLNKLYKKGEAVNMPKAVNTKELDYVPLPGRVYNYNDPLRFNPQQILQKKEQGGSIISPLGQWAYPGEITTIPSNEITMQGVPYPVLGISDIGDVQMMYPGEDYTFDGEYVTEYPMAKGGISVNEADAQPIKKLDQLLNFTNYNDMAKAKKGKKLPKAQGGFEQALGSLDTKLGSMGGIGGASTQLLGGIQTLIEEGKQRRKTQQALALSDITAKAATTRPVGLERKYVRPEDMLVDPGQVSSPYGTGLDFLQMEHGGFIGGNPTEIQNMYNPGDLYSDLGYEPLNDSNKVKQFKAGGKAFYGMETTGTTTTMTPMNPVGIGQIGSTLGSFIGGGRGEQSGAGQVGSAVGSIAGNILLPGVGGVIGGALGGLVGGAIGGQSQKAMEQKQRRIQGNLGTAALQQSLQGQFSGFMEDGGELKYLSHTWQPQKIAKFGEYDVKDLLAPPKDADMLRAGGHLKAYTPPSERAMSTERPAMQMGGELQTYWGGYAEPISYNPYLPDGGETVMFRGQSHDESDGKGRTGIGITFGQSPVEVERGEPAVKLRDGGTGEDSLVVFGNMKIPSYGATELEDPKAKGMKFKKYAEGLSKIETKANKTSDKAQSILENTDGNSPFDMLAMSTANVMMKGSDMKLKEAAIKKQLAAGIQSAILDTAEEMGLENDALAKGKIKPMKNSDMAKFGAKMETAQSGIVQYLTSQKQDGSFANRKKLAQTYGIKNYKGTAAQNTQLLNALKSKINMPLIGQPTPAQIAAEEAAFFPGNQPSGYVAPDMFESLVGGQDELPYETLASKTALPTGAQLMAMEIGDKKSRKKAIDAFLPKEASSEDKSNFNLMDFAQQLTPYVRPLIQNRLDPAQFAPEMMALATNVVEPVQAQQFRPMLEEVPTISLQDQLNEIQAEANAARRLVGNNPAGQAAIAAQAAAAKNKVLGEQTRMNQMMQLESRRKNLATLNQATLTNLDILGQQYERQSKAKSITKAQAQEALQSIAEKIGRNKAETLQANVMSNMYPQYTFGPKGRIFNTGVTSFNTPNILGYTSEELQKLTDAKKIEESKAKSPEKKRNGSIVKAIKNL